MSKIHYFQRYSTVENAVTNNTLQLLARIYDYSASQASKFLTEITGESIDIGIEINQQERAKESVPDGAVIQRSFKILIEAKVDAGVDVGQLERHAGGFSNEAQKILILLTREPIGKDKEEDISRTVSKKNPGVVFKSVTYERICKALARIIHD